MGFVRHKTTGTVDTSNVNFVGRHWIGVMNVFKKFPADLQTIVYNRVEILNNEKLAVNMTCALHYKLRPEEPHLLFDTYDVLFKPVIKGTALAAIKSKAPQFTVKEFRLNRSLVARTLSEAASQLLGGICCRKDCNKTADCRPGEKGNGIWFEVIIMSIQISINRKVLQLFSLGLHSHFSSGMNKW